MPKKNSVGDHLLFCNQLASYEDSMSDPWEQKVLQELEESLFIVRDQPSLNGTVRDTPFSYKQSKI